MGQGGIVVGRGDGIVAGDDLWPGRIAGAGSLDRGRARPGVRLGWQGIEAGLGGAAGLGGDHRGGGGSGACRDHWGRVGGLYDQDA